MVPALSLPISRPQVESHHLGTFPVFFLRTKYRLIFTGSWTIDIRDCGNWNMYFTPKHDVFIILTKSFLCLNLNKALTQHHHKRETENWRILISGSAEMNLATNYFLKSPWVRLFIYFLHRARTVGIQPNHQQFINTFINTEIKFQSGNSFRVKIF